MAAKEKTKKSPAKRSTPRKIARAKEPQMLSEIQEPTIERKSMLSKRRLLWLVIVFALALLLYQYKGALVAATVNGKPVSRYELIRELERQSGEEALDSLITKQLIVQEAAKNGVSVTEDEVRSEIEQIEQSISAQGMTLDEALELQGQSRAALEESIRLNKLMEKLISSDISVSDEEVSQYYEQNKELLGENAKFEDMKEDIKQQLYQQKLSERASQWLGDLKNNAKINYFVSF